MKSYGWMMAGRRTHGLRRSRGRVRIESTIPMNREPHKKSTTIIPPRGLEPLTLGLEGLPNPFPTRCHNTLHSEITHFPALILFWPSVIIGSVFSSIVPKLCQGSPDSPCSGSFTVASNWFQRLTEMPSGIWRSTASFEGIWCEEEEGGESRMKNCPRPFHWGKDEGSTWRPAFVM